MRPINILEARNALSKLVAAAVDGEDVVIAKRGRPVVRLVPIEGDSWRADAAASWLQSHLVPGRSPAELDQQISRERDAWV